MKKILATILAAALAGGAWAAGASLTTSGTTMTPGDFRTTAIASAATYDGSGVTVDFATAESGIGMVHSSDGFELYALGNSDSKRSTDITIKNVKFKLSGTGTCGSSTYSTAQLYLYTTANVTFENCVFENVGVSMNGSAASAKATFKDCTFDSVKNYAIKYVENVEVLDCSFNACNRAMMIWSDSSKTPADVVTISGCEFTNITKDRIIKFYNFVTDAETQMQITGNTVYSSSTASFTTVDFDSGYDADSYTYTFTFTGNTGITADNLNENNTEKMLYISSNSLVDDESAVVTSGPVTNSVQSVNLFGSIKVTGVASNMYVAVPFEGFDGTARQAKDVVHAATLAEGTRMYVYDRAADKYDVFDVDANGQWTAAPKATINADGKTTFDTADLTRAVAVGTGVLVERKDKTQAVDVYGEIPTAAAEPVSFNAGQTLVSAPSTNAMSEVNLNAFAWTGVAAARSGRLTTSGADYIQFRDANNNQIRYFWLADGSGWGLQPTQARKYPELVADGKALIPAGTAFWYWSKNGGAQVTW